MQVESRTSGGANTQRTAENLHSTLLFETAEQLWARVFQEVKPRTAVPRFSVSYARFASANSFIRLESGSIEVRITDVLEDAPAPVSEALAFILLSKLYRKPVPATASHRYRLYLNRKDVRQRLETVRQQRGRKHLTAPRGEHFDLEQVFEDLNFRYFDGLMARPRLGWSHRVSTTALGHYDSSHHTIVISRLFDQAGARLALDYVMFHEMLHLRHPVEHRGARRCVHGPEFRKAERKFEGLEAAKMLTRRLIEAVNRR